MSVGRGIWGCRSIRCDTPIWAAGGSRSLWPVREWSRLTGPRGGFGRTPRTGPRSGHRDRTGGFLVRHGDVAAGARGACVCENTARRPDEVVVPADGPGLPVLRACYGDRLVVVL